MQRLTELIQKSPALSLLRAANVPLASAREKASLAVTPLVPYLRYVETPP